MNNQVSFDSLLSLVIKTPATIIIFISPSKLSFQFKLQFSNFLSAMENKGVKRRNASIPDVALERVVEHIDDPKDRDVISSKVL